ncbi:hypothetical protein C5708_03095 [Caulobacter sp. CCUG 60055]|uniref:universal stress protein n=1 Tax=Caulobacter sp. CCUG 60055 TaxID=2100090 RepID=UPI001FA6C2F6|nr:universal stress protein [Caulobacter sp. CCUG 60055]MCI3179232.1 hypothetical protein [Caulobacter sp. CCUG 60055]
MDIRDILLFLHAGAPSDRAIALAAGWAKGHGATVTACCLCADPAPSNADCFAIGFAGAADVLDRRMARIEAAGRPVQVALCAAAAAAGIVVDWVLPDPNEPPEALALRALFFDLAIVPRAPVDDHPARELAEALVLRSGAPCVITPQTPAAKAVSNPSGRRIVLAWNGSPPARRAIDDAWPLLRRAEAVELLVLGEDPRWLDHCRPEQMLRRLERHGVRAELRVSPRDGGTAGTLAQACAEFGADLLVMGAYSHPRARETVLGGATRTVLADFPIPVLMSR